MFDAVGIKEVARAACSSEKARVFRQQTLFCLFVVYPFLRAIRSPLTRAFTVLRVTRVNG